MDPKFVISLNGREYPTYQGVLAEAHERGVKCISVELVQVPSADNDNTAIMKATVILENGETFSDYGDASPRNTSSRVATALMRMASTRAKGRALRDAVNIGQTMLEELPDDETAPAGNGKARAHQAVTAAETQDLPARVSRPAPPPPKPQVDPAPGFEPWFEAGNRKLQRVSLISTCLADISAAQERGLRVEPIEPEKATNEALYMYGKALRARLKEAKAAPESEKSDTAGGARHDPAH